MKINLKNLLTAFLLTIPCQIFAATADLTPASYDYGNVTIGSVSTQVFTITYTGAAAGNLTVASATVSAVPFSKILDGCTGITIPAPGGTCSIVVQYTPTAVTTSAGTLTVVTNATDGTQKIASLLGAGVTGPTVTASITPTSNSYGNVTVGSSSTATFTIENTGGSINLTIASATVSAAPFVKTADNCTGATLPLAGTCTVEVTYFPTAATNSLGTLTVVTNATNGTQKIASLSGTGVTGPTVTASITPTSNAFGSVTVGSSSSATFTIENTGGTVNLTITSATASAAPFIKTADNCTGATLPLAGTCTIEVTYFPTTAAVSSGTLTVVTNATNGTNKIVSLSGTGTSATSATASISPTTFNFGSVAIGDSDTNTFTITNTGGSGNLNITTVTVSALPFSVVSDSCAGATLAFNATCTFVVRFAPTAAGIFAGTTTVATNATNGTNKIASLAGTTPTPGSLAFGSATYAFKSDVGTAVLYVTRTGGDSGVVAVDYETSPGTASVIAQDFVEKSGTLTWSDGDTSPKKIEIEIMNNTFEDDNRTFYVILSNPTNDSTLGTNNTAAVELYNLVQSENASTVVEDNSGCSTSGAGSNSLWIMLLTFVIWQITKPMRIFRGKSR